MDNEIIKIVEKLNLQKLWDKDFIKEDYSSDITIQIGNPKRPRPLFNWAYYLIPKGCIFYLHRLLSDESWQYCLGGAVDLFSINDGVIEQVRVGPDIFNDEKLFHIVKKDTWFAATPAPSSKFTLITHCVSPGWVPEDDIPGFYEEMIKLAPKQADFIKKFSWPNDRTDYRMHDLYKSNEI